jgi:hypothetical protein
MNTNLKSPEELTQECKKLESLLLRAGFIRCASAVCNCGSWHQLDGLTQRFEEIKAVLRDAEVLDNSVGNLPLRAIEKLIAQRNVLRGQLQHEAELCVDIALTSGTYARQVQSLRAAVKPLADKWLYPDDIEGHTDEAASDETLEESWLKRSDIRAARKALSASAPVSKPNLTPSRGTAP